MQGCMFEMMSAERRVANARAQTLELGLAQFAKAMNNKLHNMNSTIQEAVESRLRITDDKLSAASVAIDEIDVKFHECFEEDSGSGVEENDDSDEAADDLMSTIDDLDRRAYEHTKNLDDLQVFVRRAAKGMHSFQPTTEDSYPKVIERLEVRCTEAVRQCASVAEAIASRLKEHEGTQEATRPTSDRAGPAHSSDIALQSLLPVMSETLSSTHEVPPCPLGCARRTTVSAQTSISAPSAACVQVLTVPTRIPDRRLRPPDAHGDDEGRDQRRVAQAEDQYPPGLETAKPHGKRRGRWRQDPAAPGRSRDERTREEANAAASQDLEVQKEALRAMKIKATEESIGPSSKGQVKQKPPPPRASMRTKSTSSSSSSGTSGISRTSSRSARRRRRAPPQRRSLSPPPAIF